MNLENDYLKKTLYFIKSYKKIIVRLDSYDKEIIAELHKMCNVLNTDLAIFCDTGENYNILPNQEYDFYLYFINQYGITCQNTVKETIDYRYNIYKALNVNSLIYNGKWHVLYYTKLIKNSDKFLLLNRSDYMLLMKKCIPLYHLLKKGSEIKIVSDENCLVFNYNNNNVFCSFGQHNTPDGEIGVIPNMYSTNGTILFSSINYQNHFFHNVRMHFKNGTCINLTCSDESGLKEVINYDKHSSYIGEFAFGLNPWINHKSNIPLLDEKQFGTFHLALGGVSNKNSNSFIHLDMINDDSKSHIYIDNKCIYNKGKFINELEFLTIDYLKNS